jgi:Rad3-related DNA helicase
MTEPEALRLADRLDCGEISYTGMCKAAAELRRLYAVNQELLAAAKRVVAWYEAEDDHSKADFYTRLVMCRESESALRAAIAKGEAK